MASVLHAPVPNTTISSFGRAEPFDGALGSSPFLERAHRAASDAPSALKETLKHFRDRTSAGAVLFRNLPVGDLPATPIAAGTVDKPDRTSETTLLGVASLLGEPIGYEQEHGGDIVQNLYPLESSVGRQVSTSSGVELAFHTETAFHPHKPRYLALLCLKGDPSAQTTLCSVDAIMSQLTDETIRILSEPRFRCGVDESFAEECGVNNWLTPPAPVLVVHQDQHLELTFDGELTIGLDAEAEQSLAAVREAIACAHTSVTLEAGDLLIIDNHHAVHGRSPFTARFDGTDRWLQRTFIVDDLNSIGDDLDGRVITTRFNQLL